MSHVELPGFCYCDCHRPGSHAMHIAACCDGRCRTCHKYVQRGRMEQHQQEHEERRREIAAEHGIDLS